MDLIPQEHDAAAYKNSYFEYNVAMNQNKSYSANKLKTQVYASMDQLEGWCSKEKASELIDLILKLKPKVIVEIGVFGGKSLVPMAFALKYNCKGKIYGIDPWEASESEVGMDGANKEWWSSVDHTAIYEGLKHKIAQFGLQDFSELIKVTSEAAAPIPNIDILHIDGNHSEETSYFDVNKWVPLVKSGGIVIFDDVTWGTTSKAVQWLDENCVKIAEFTGDNVWGVWQKP